MFDSTTLASTDLERYIELDALELLLTSDYALGNVLNGHLRSVDLLEQSGFDLRVGDGTASLQELYASLNPDEPAPDDVPGQLKNAREDLLIARMLRSLASHPEELGRRADYFERLAESNLAAFAAGHSAMEFRAGSFMLAGDDA